MSASVLRKTAMPALRSHCPLKFTMVLPVGDSQWFLDVDRKKVGAGVFLQARCQFYVNFNMAEEKITGQGNSLTVLRSWKICGDVSEKNSWRAPRSPGRGGEGGDAEAVGALGKVRRLECPNGATHTSTG